MAEKTIWESPSVKLTIEETRNYGCMIRKHWQDGSRSCLLLSEEHSVATSGATSASGPFNRCSGGRP